MYNIVAYSLHMEYITWTNTSLLTICLWGVGMGRWYTNQCGHSRHKLGNHTCKLLNLNVDVDGGPSTFPTKVPPSKIRGFNKGLLRETLISRLGSLRGCRLTSHDECCKTPPPQLSTWPAKATSSALFLYLDSSTRATIGRSCSPESCGSWRETDDHVEIYEQDSGWFGKTAQQKPMASRC